MTNLLLHIFLGGLLLMWAYPTLPEIFPNAGLLPTLTYWQCVTIQWVVSIVFPPIAGGVELGIRQARKEQ